MGLVAGIYGQSKSFRLAWLSWGCRRDSNWESVLRTTSQPYWSFRSFLIDSFVFSLPSLTTLSLGSGGFFCFLFLLSPPTSKWVSCSCKWVGDTLQWTSTDFRQYTFSRKNRFFGLWSYTLRVRQNTHFVTSNSDFGGCKPHFFVEFPENVCGFPRIS